MSFVPHHEVVEQPGATRTALVLHGILGQGRNWRSFARKLTEDHPTWRFVLVDHRNHGQSGPVAVGPHTVVGCAADLAALCAALEVEPEMVIGHSFGGKVALAYARDHAPHSLHQVWVLDSLPGVPDQMPTPADNEVMAVIDAITTIEMPVASRQQVKDQLRQTGFGETLVAWLATSLTRVDGQWHWVLGLEGVQQMIADYFVDDFWPYLEESRLFPEIHFVRAGLSDRWDNETLERFEDLPSTSQVELVVLEDAGHWVQADNPDGLAALMADSFD